jgi:hypothetical protein
MIWFKFTDADGADVLLNAAHVVSARRVEGKVILTTVVVVEDEPETFAAAGPDADALWSYLRSLGAYN